jgi:FMN phosphatase YigB (HAD superfamily)
MSGMREPRLQVGVVELGQTIEAITLDFGNTLVPFPAALMGTVLRSTAERAAPSAGVGVDEFLLVWMEERQRQMDEDVPEGREAYMDVRAVRVLARLRGCPVPQQGRRWNDAIAVGYSSPAEVAAVVEAYATAFVDLTPVPPEIGPMLERLAGSYRLAILSNWPLALAVDRFVDSAGWRPYLSAVVVSHRVGSIKPWPAIFETTARALAVPSGARLLHVGDDLGADVAGAHAVGWRAAWVRVKPEDSPLPFAPFTGHELPDLVIDRVTDLPHALGLRGPRVP